jgi:hypothetical protein
MQIAFIFKVKIFSLLFGHFCFFQSFVVYAKTIITSVSVNNFEIVALNNHSKHEAPGRCSVTG